MATKQFQYVECEHCEKRGDSIFCNTQHDNLTTISDSKSCTLYRKGQVLFSEGNHPLGLYCINKGKLKLERQGDDGRDQIVRMYKSGDVIGYRSMLINERYSATATVLEDSQICFIPKETFLQTLKKDAHLSMEVMKLMSRQLREAEQRITNLAQKPVRERVAESLLFLKETYGFEDDAKTIAVQLTREEVANLVGTATETVIRLLSDLNKEGVITLSGKKIAINNTLQLATIANIID